MENSLNEPMFDEAFKIISMNKNKANSLRQFLLKNNKYDNDENKIIQYLGEFEYDLKTLYNILRDLKISYHNKNREMKGNIKEENNKSKKETNNHKKNKQSKKEKLILNNDYDNLGNNYDGISKTYSMTTSQMGNYQNYNNNLNDYLINSYPERNSDKKIPRSMSCKSYIGNWNSNYKGFEFLDNDINNNINNNKKYLENKNYNDEKFPNNILYNNKYLNSLYGNGNMSKDKTIKLNFDYDAYLTDYSLNRTNKNDINDSKNDNLSNSKRNLNLSDLNNDNDLNKNLNNNNIDNQINKNSNIGNNNINNNINRGNDNIPLYNNGNLNEYDKLQNDIMNNKRNEKDENNNIFTFSEPKNENKSIINNYDITFNPNNNQNINDLKRYNKENNLVNNSNNNDNLNLNDYKNINIDSKRNYNYNKDDNRFINILNKYNNDLNQNNNNNHEDINRKINNINNNSYNDNNINSIDNHMETDDDLEMQKNEIIKSVISEIFQDKKKLDYLKNYLGDDIGQKLLKRNISAEELYKVAEILNNYQLNNNGTKNHKNFKKKKFNQPSDKILLKESLNNKRYNYREYPRGWNSTKDYFVNNGSTFLKSNRGQK